MQERDRIHLTQWCILFVIERTLNLIFATNQCIFSSASQSAQKYHNFAVIFEVTLYSIMVFCNCSKLVIGIVKFDILKNCRYLLYVPFLTCNQQFVLWNIITFCLNCDFPLLISKLGGKPLLERKCPNSEIKS